MAYDALFALANATHASTMALATCSLICDLVPARSAAAPDRTTLANGTAVAPCARASALNAISASAAAPHTRNDVVVMKLLPIARCYFSFFVRPLPSRGDAREGVRRGRSV